MFHPAVFVLGLVFKLTTAQDADCNFQSNVGVNETVYVYRPENYPSNYTRGMQCRWIAICPENYNCRLDCPDIDLPYAPGCTIDRLLVSKSGDPQLTGAEQYCGKGSLGGVISTGRRINVGLVVSNNSPGGKFYCTVKSQRTTTPDPATCQCGYKKTNRIVGGEETKVNEFPMMAGLAERSIYQIKCGAVIINPRCVVTAAHCVYRRGTDEFAVIVGEHNVTTNDSPATQGFLISSFVIHPQYTPSTYNYDAAIVNIQGQIVFSDLVGPVCLPFGYTAHDFTGEYVTALGWGTQFIGGPTSDVLRKVDLQIISQSDCKAQTPSLTSAQICAYSPGKDTCQDDSGGPFLYQAKQTGRLMFVGIVSAGQYCASNTASVNTRVTAITDWIVANAPYDYCVS